MKQQFLKLYVTFFGLGLSPKLPATLGILGAALVSLLFLQFVWWVQILVILLLAVSGIVACQMYEDEFKVQNSQEIVIDKVVGYLIAVFWLPLTWQSLLGAFLLFHILITFKPLVIGMASKKLKGGLGVMADDILAGIASGIVMQFVLSDYPKLLGL